MLSKVGFVLACTALAAGDRLCENITCSVKARSSKTFSDSLTKFSYETCTFLDDDLSCKHATERLLKRGRESRRSGCKENLPELKHIADDVCKQSMEKSSKRYGVKVPLHLTGKPDCANDLDKE